MTRATLHPRLSRIINLALAVLIFSGTVFPTGFASAQLLFGRPGAGVSRLPLNVFAFDAPGFGDVSAAINLATGNVFVDAGGIAYNATLEESDESQGSFTNWNVTQRLRLQGFNKDLQEAPSYFFLGSGDGSGEDYLLSEIEDFSTVPVWIERYEDKENTYFYQSAPRQGTQYRVAWVVLELNSEGDTQAYFFERDGTRHTFDQDGEYVDYIQTEYQQLRGDAKTEITYFAPLFDERGLIREIKDEYGRITRYEWDGPLLKSIKMLPLQGESAVADYAREIRFSYETTFSDKPPLLEKVTYRTDTMTRSVRFGYKDGRVHTISRDVLGGDAVHTITYEYEKDTNRLWTVAQPDLPKTTYKYNLDNSVEVTQGDKYSVFRFDDAGRLTSKDIWSRSGDAEQKQPLQILTWSYTYDGNGNIASVTDPAGKIEHFDHDARGNLTSTKTFDEKIANPNAAELRELRVSMTAPNDRTGVNPGGTLQLDATVEEDGAPVSVPLIWSVDRGKVDADGHFTAPEQTGPGHCFGTEHAEP